MKAMWLRFGGVLSMGLVASGALCVDITLTDGGSSVDIQNDGSVHAGNVYNWFLGGADHLYQEEYFFRYGNSGAVDAIGALGNPTGIKLLDKYAEFYYGLPGGILVEVDYLLNGGTTTATLSEAVLVYNDSNQVVHFELFEYDDFDLQNDWGDDFAIRNDMHSISQYDDVVAINGEVVIGPAADYNEVGGYPTLLNGMLAGTFTNLNTANSQFGPGDAAFAFQWVFDLAPGHSFSVSKDKVLTVPEPGSLLAFGGLCALAFARRKRT